MVKWFIVVALIGLARGGVIGDLVDGVSDTICMAKSIPGALKCGIIFTDELKASEIELHKDYKQYGYCCAFTHLRDCVTQSVSTNCGDYTAGTFNKVFGAVLKTVKVLDTSADECSLFDGIVGTFLCQPIGLLVAEVVVLVLLFLVGFWSVIRCCCSPSRNRHRSYATAVLLPSHNRTAYK
ncbi:unnamed protein product [Medioppia subpectinata]|uniref:Uncharacterized protein n=1 Tax=Medioppia subpectinata TaxID=1979941 RepID=A0A7R9KN19_9ACAR|nr:unnamed protein product [Medioppia subpectinata]CAG2106612.1 unnamed protein product [Medioppia subpectinata]